MHSDQDQDRNSGKDYEQHLKLLCTLAEHDPLLPPDINSRIIPVDLFSSIQMNLLRNVPYRGSCCRSRMTERCEAPGLR